MPTADLREIAKAKAAKKKDKKKKKAKGPEEHWMFKLGRSFRKASTGK